MTASRYSVTVTDSPASTGSPAASPTISARAGISADEAPSKVSRRTEPGWTAAPRAVPARAVRARVAPAIRSGEVPYTFERRIRTRSPPAVRRTAWRREWRQKPSCDQLGVKPVLGGCGEAVQAVVNTALPFLTGLWSP
ncbi:hypothetical protein [Streptomyces aurantiacus]|uniref:hypothetical protein n=1 Tax=Streptomyces aurantiacus TaxID=47760 RepID=UPI000AE38D13